MAKISPSPGWLDVGSMVDGLSKSRFAGVQQSFFCLLNVARRRCGHGQHSGQHTAIALGLTPGNGEKIDISGLSQRRLDGRQLVKERIHEGKAVNFLLPQGD